MTQYIYPMTQCPLLGQGAEGKVYKITQGNQILAHKICDNVISQDEKQFLDLLMKQSIKSPMMKIYQHQEFKGHTYLIEEQYFEGGSLDRKLYNLQKTDIEQIILQIGEQLEFIHNNGYVYQDLKLSNIVFGRDPESPNFKLYKLCDFGTIKKVNKTEKVFNPEKRDGTVNYLPFDEYTDCPLDIFSFGAFIYELISKQQLFQGNQEESKRAKRQFYKNQTEIYEKINQLKDTTLELKNLLKRMLDSYPNNRPKILEINQFFKSNFIYCDNCKKYQLECLRLNEQIKKLTQENQELQEIIKKQNEKQLNNLNESCQTESTEDFLQLNDEYVCNIQLAEKIEILNQKLYRSSGRKFQQNGNTGLILLEQQIDNIIKEFLNKVKEDCQVMKDLKGDNLNLNEKLEMKEDQLKIKGNELVKLNEQLKMKENELKTIKIQLTDSMREKYVPAKQLVKVQGLHNQISNMNSRSQNCFFPNLMQNKEVRHHK